MMADLSLPLASGLVLILGLVVASFAVSWISTDVYRMTRSAYIAVLATVTGLATAAILAMLDTSSSGWELLTDNAAAGVVAGGVAGAIVVVGLRRVRATSAPLEGRALVAKEAWEGVVYGIAEGLLLSALPALAAWAVVRGQGWSEIAGWVAALLASAVTIAIHHFGYWDYRGRAVVAPVGACLILTIAYLASGSLVAPLIGHVLLHVAGIRRGVELPPHRKVGRLLVRA